MGFLILENYLYTKNKNEIKTNVFCNNNLTVMDLSIAVSQ